MCAALGDLLSRATNPRAILAAIGEVSVALERRQAAREIKPNPPAPVAHTRS
jgi:hypothetical protein